MKSGVIGRLCTAVGDSRHLPDEESQLLNIHVADCDECLKKLALMNAVQGVAKTPEHLAYQ